MGVILDSATDGDGKAIRYFYTSGKKDSTYGVVLGIPAEDETALRGCGTTGSNTDSGAYTNYYYSKGQYSAEALLALSGKENPSADVNGNPQFFVHPKEWAGWQWFSCDGDDTVYSVVVADAAGNYSPAYTFHVIKDVAGPAVYDSSNSYITMTYSDPTNSASGEKWGVFTTPQTQTVTVTAASSYNVPAYSGTAYKNIYAYHSNNTAAGSRAQINVDLPSAYTEQSCTAAASRIEYYATNAYSTTAPSSTSSSAASWNAWVPYTEGYTSFTTYPIMASASVPATGPLYLWLKDGCGNTSCMQIRSDEHRKANADETWELDGEGLKRNASSWTGFTTEGYTNTVDGYLVQSGNVNYYNEKATPIIYLKEDHCVSSSSPASESSYSARYVIKAISSSASVPTKAAADADISLKWTYLNLPDIAYTYVKMAYPTDAANSKLILLTEDAVGNYTTDTLTDNSVSLWTYDNTAPDISISAYPAAPTGKTIYADGTHIYYPAGTTVTFLSTNTADITGYVLAYYVPQLTTYNSGSPSSLIGTPIDMGTYFGSFSDSAGAPLYFYVRDLVGNTRCAQIVTESGASSSQTWSYDSTCPAASSKAVDSDSATYSGGSYIISYTGGNITLGFPKNGTSAAITIPSAAYTDQPAGTEITSGLKGISTDGTSYSGASWDLSLSSITASTQTMTVYVYDNAGNRSSSSYTISYSRDDNSATAALTWPQAQGVYSALKGGAVKSSSFADYTLTLGTDKNTEQDGSSSLPYIFYTKSATVTPTITFTKSSGTKISSYIITASGSGAAVTNSSGSSAVTTSYTSLATKVTEYTVSGLSFASGSSCLYSVGVKDMSGNETVVYFKLIYDNAVGLSSYPASIGTGYYTASSTSTDAVVYTTKTDTNQSFTLSGTDSLSGTMGFYSDTEAATEVTAISFASAPTETATTQTVYAFDNAGNSQAITLSLALDSTAPTYSAPTASVALYCGTLYTAGTTNVATGSTGYANGTAPVLTFTGVSDAGCGIKSVNGTNGTAAYDSTNKKITFTFNTLSAASSTTGTVTITDNLDHTTTYTLTLTAAATPSITKVVSTSDVYSTTSSASISAGNEIASDSTVYVNVTTLPLAFTASSNVGIGTYSVDGGTTKKTYTAGDYISLSTASAYTAYLYDMFGNGTAAYTITVTKDTASLVSLGTPSSSTGYSIDKSGTSKYYKC